MEQRLSIAQRIGAWWKGGEDKQPSPESISEHPEAEAFAGGYGGYYGNYQPVYPMVYDGEKNLGEVGPIYQYFLDYYRLKLRSRQLYVESEICKAVIDKNTKWIVGKGLTLQAEPQVDVLAIEGIKIDSEAFNKQVESLWKIYANTTMADITGKRTLNELLSEACDELGIGGDMLVLLSVTGTTVKIRHIDGAHVMTPPTLAITGTDAVLDNGNRLRMGVEIDKQGRRVAYYVKKDIIGLEFDRIEAYGKKSGMLMAYLCSSKKYTVDSERSMPLLMSVIETAKKLERYTSAALSGAEETAKIAYFIEHGQNSTNEDPLIGRRAKALAGRGNLQADLAVDAEGNRKAAEIAVSTNKTVVNLGNDQTIKSLDSKQEANVKEFGMFNIDLVAAAVGIPPNVVLSKYEDSFSASRMSGKDWEHTFLTKRQNLAQQYLNPVYALQIYVWVLANKIQAPGYLTAFSEGNELALRAYLHCRWEGDMFPDIDPLKTATALRKLAGPSMDHLPFITGESAAEIAGQGDIQAILKQVGKERELAESVGIEPIETNAQPDVEEPEEEKKKSK